MKTNQSTKFLAALWTAIVCFFVLRLIENSLLIYNTHFSPNVMKQEWIGWLWDVSFVGVFFFLLKFFSQKIPQKAHNSLFVAGLVISGILIMAHLLIVAYFVYEGSPLDIFIYKYPLQEIVFTIKTSNLPLKWIFLAVGGMGLLPILLFQFFRKIQKARSLTNISFKSYVLLTGIQLLLLLLISFNFSNKYVKNKSLDFYWKSIQYAFSSDKIHPMTSEDLSFFQSLYPQKEFESKEYPLLHRRKQNKELFHRMEKFDATPNIVVLIVEGLNDDFVQKRYHGIELMPFMNELKGRSLYWNRCFSQGERSFAAVPSILGSLPFGEDGFTSLNIYPNHHSLVNLLAENGYQTNYFTGVDAWFHTINKWLKYNNANLIFDKMNFDDSFQKIHVDNYFWGYDDKSMYRQYFKVKDTLFNQQPYLDMFFSQSSHSPYLIPEAKKYESKIRSFQTDSNRQFIQTYLKYLSAVRFVDDALKDFFSEYQQRPDFENTVFIITGDHPATELPRDNALKKYHVPLMIYSPKLKSPEVFTNDVCHLDITPTVVDFLEQYGVDFPTKSAALGQSIFENTPREIPFMTGNFELLDYYSNGTFIAGDEYYQVDDKLGLSPLIDSEQQQLLKAKRANFRIINDETSFRNKIMDEQLYLRGLSREEIYSFQEKKPLVIEQEFTPVLEGHPVDFSNFSMDVYLEMKKKATSEILWVAQVKDDKDSIISWQSFSLSDVHFFQHRLEYAFPQFEKRKRLYVDVIFWNKKKEKMTVSQQDIVLSTSTKKN